MSTLGFGPFGSAPFGGLPGSGVEYVADGFALATSLAGTNSPNLIERVELASSLSVSAAIDALLSDDAAMTDAVNIAWLKLIEESAGLADTTATVLTFLGAIGDTLIATGAADTRVAAMAAIVEAGLIEDLARAGYNLDVASSAAGTDAVSARLRALVAAAEAAQVADAATPLLRLTALVADDADLSGVLSSSARLSAAISEGLQLFATIRIGDDEYSAWVLSLNQSGDGQVPAVVEYQNFPFNSFVEFDGRYFGASEYGVFELFTGDDDDGEPIDAWVRTALSNLGTGKQKRMPAVYLGYTSSGQMVLKVVTTRDDGAKAEDWYELSERTATAHRESRIKVGRGLKSVYWAFELQNKGGADFALDVVELFPMILERRL